MENKNVKKFMQTKFKFFFSFSQTEISLRKTSVPKIKLKQDMENKLNTYICM